MESQIITLNARPLRQAFDGYLVENGAFYISKTSDIIIWNKDFRQYSLWEMPEETYFEIDGPHDLDISHYF